MNKTLDNVHVALKSRRFIRFVIGFFIFESAWIALTASYPQAFDEQFHFGLIKIYSHHWLPFLTGQPANANQFGAVARDPSYLYHYLMSFPYRLIALVTSRQAYQIIILRFINIGMFASGLVLFRKILIKSKLSAGLSNLAILLFALIPIVPQLAGQINYDNMLFPLLAIICLLTFRLIDEIKALKLSFKTPVQLLILSTLTSLVKYAFLPIYLGIICFFTFFLIKYYRHKIPKLISSLVADWKKQSLKLRVLLISLLIISIGMFAQRDVVNILKYHAIEPDCAKVLSVKACSSYTVWSSDYSRHQSAIISHNVASKNIFYYIGQWIYWMWYRLFFAVNGQASKYTNYPPLPLPSAIAALIGIVGVIAVIKYRRELFRANTYAYFLLTTCVFYIVALVIQGYSTYQFTDVLENMNGRYLLPILLLMAAIFGRAFSIALRKSSLSRAALACVVILLFVQGGGIITFINRSNQTWDWQNPSVVKINNAARHITSPLVIDGKKTYQTKLWFFN